MGIPNQSGLIVSVYRAANFPDCSNRGLSSRHDELTLLLPQGGPFEPKPERPAVRLVRKEVMGNEYLSVIPADAEGDGIGQYMFGGNFIFTSDSRFPDKGYPIPIHDRTE